MPHDDAAWLLPGCAPGAAGSSRGLFQEYFLGGSANWTAPAAGLAAETPDDGKALECASLPVCLKPSDGLRGQYPKSYAPSPRTMIVAPSCSAFHGVADDREMILRSADRGAQRSGITAADGHIPVGERRIDGNRALQLRQTSLHERGCINAEVLFHGDGVRRGGSLA
ncbi:hypothetical protein BJ878DRAFT_543027 [Calycina marina]|uniref:Uncharacterized protein n=1 Tax=Calycina marina TaxID=1763456 RepID=A0A9P8CE31_9HELO|nr:hypothetical protein BJ878DRAFT_543027 [Calycina marina]